MLRPPMVRQLALAMLLFAAACAPPLWLAQWLRDRPLAAVEGLRYYRDAAGVAVFEGRIRNKTAGTTLSSVRGWLRSPDGEVAVEARSIGPGTAKPFRQSMGGFPGWGARGLTAEVASVYAVPSPSR